MNKRHLAVAVVAALALSSSTIASAEGGSHRKMGDYDHITSVVPIALSNSGGILTIDTSTAVPSFLFDTTTVTPHIDFDASNLTTHFDTSTATSGFDDEPGISDDGVGEDDSLPAGNSPFPLNPGIPPAGLNTPVVPVDPNAPATPALPSWITKSHAKSNDDNPDHSDQSSDDSQD